MRMIIIGLLLALGACTTQADVVSLSGPSSQLPKIELLGRGFGGGPFRVTMPDGEVLSGRYIAPGGGGMGFGSGMVAGRSVTMTTTYMGGGGSFAAQATGPRTSIACNGNWGGFSGTALCETSQGGRFQMMF